MLPLLVVCGLGHSAPCARGSRPDAGHSTNREIAASEYASCETFRAAITTTGGCIAVRPGPDPPISKGAPPSAEVSMSAAASCVLA